MLSPLTSSGLMSIRWDSTDCGVDGQLSAPLGCSYWWFGATYVQWQPALRLDSIRNNHYVKWFFNLTHVKFMPDLALLMGALVTSCKIGVVCGKSSEATWCSDLWSSKHDMGLWFLLAAKREVFSKGSTVWEHLQVTCSLQSWNGVLQPWDGIEQAQMFRCRICSGLF